MTTFRSDHRATAYAQRELLAVTRRLNRLRTQRDALTKRQQRLNVQSMCNQADIWKAIERMRELTR